jgi:glutamate synthase (NADPH/NADH) small chain
MAKSPDFLDIPRRVAEKERVDERLKHFREFSIHLSDEELREQSARCMNCGVPFCHGSGCPLGNNIPEFNALVHEGRWRDASDLLHETNNFPEITGRLCPATCEAACVNAIEGEATTIRQIELAVVEKAWLEGWVAPVPPSVETGKKIAIVGSGPSGLAAAQQLRRAGHAVTVYEKAPEPGGILRYGIPDFKLGKRILSRRLAQLRAEGVRFELNVEAGVDITGNFLRKRYDAICLCGGAGTPRDLDIPGRDADGIHFAMDYLIQSNLRAGDEAIPSDREILAEGRDVVILGGGDTGSDCLGTALRQGAASVTQLELLSQPPEGENPETPWPRWPLILRTSTSHEEGGERDWSVNTLAFTTQEGRVTGLQCQRLEWQEDPATGRMAMTPILDSEFELKADLVLLALGFVRPIHAGLLDGLEVAYDPRGNVQVDEHMMTSVPGVFAAGDMQTGAWLIVGAIAGGRRMARNVDLYLMGESALPDTPPPTAL